MAILNGEIGGSILRDGGDIEWKESSLSPRKISDFVLILGHKRRKLSKINSVGDVPETVSGFSVDPDPCAYAENAIS